MRVIRQDDIFWLVISAAASLMGLGAVVGTVTYLMIRYPAFLPIWPALGMGFAIGAMERTTGERRRQWSWVAIVSGVLAGLAIIAS